TSGVTVATVPVAAVAVTPSPASVQVGSTVQLTASPTDANGTPLTGRVVTRTSSDTVIATVSGKGLVTGRAPGSATITATSEGKSGTSALTVLGVPVASVTVTPSPATVQVGQTVQLTAAPKDANGNPLTGRLVAWTSSDTTIAKVSNSGLVTGRAAGSATITATSEAKSGTSAVSVTIVPVASVTLSPASTSVSQGSTVQLAATPKDANGNPLSGRVGTWRSFARHHDSKDQPWSADGSLIALMNRNGGSPSDLYLDGNTYQPVRGICSNYSISDDRWHPSPAHPHERVAVSGTELM